MWCEQCQADTAAQANTVTGHVTCATCGSEVKSEQFGKLDKHLQQARDLLDRWSKEPLLEPYSPLPERKASHLSEIASSKKPKTAETSEHSPKQTNPVQEEPQDNESLLEEFLSEGLSKRPLPKFRFDRKHQEELNADSVQISEPEAEGVSLEGFADFAFIEVGASDSNPEVDALPAIEVGTPTDDSEEVSALDQTVFETPNPEPLTEPPAPDTMRPIANEVEIESMSQSMSNENCETESDIEYPVESTDSLRLDPPRLEDPVPAPHIDIRKLIEQKQLERPKRLNWLMLIGQWLAYLGVLCMTAGAAIVVYGYFGGSEELTPRGWMLTTAGQMLLFLGIVTLISNGIERSNEEINDRIEILGDQILRFERETKQQLVKGPKQPVSDYAQAEPESTSRSKSA